MKKHNLKGLALTWLAAAVPMALGVLDWRALTWHLPGWEPSPASLNNEMLRPGFHSKHDAQV